jgi:hypothetical protein
MVCWSFFSFAVSFDFGCCSLAQMSFVDRYLPCFRQQLITGWLSALLPLQPLFTESSHRHQHLVPPTFSSVLSASCPLCCVLVFSSLFLVQFFFSAQGSMLVYPRCGWGNTAWCLALTCLVCQMSPKQVWSQCLAAVGALLYSQCNMVWKSFLRTRGSGCRNFDSPWCFISTKCGLSQQDFWFTELMLFASAP